jgi:hypothetical protein
VANRGRSGAAAGRRPTAAARGWARTTALALAVAAAVGCGYSFSGRGKIGDVFIPFFEDQTSGDRAVDVGTDLTQRVIAEFQQDRSTRVFQAPAERTHAEKELLGTVRRVTETLLSRDPSEVGEEYIVVVQCSVTFRDLATDAVLWQDQSVRGDGVYALDRGDAGFQAALQEALDEIVDTIVDKTLRAW